MKSVKYDIKSINWPFDKSDGAWYDNLDAWVKIDILTHTDIRKEGSH